jgi:hypothetical protein
MFFCRIVARAAERYYGAIQRPSPFAAGMEAIWQQGVDTLANAFS